MKCGRHDPMIVSLHTLGDLTQIFPTFSNPTLNLSFYINAGLKLTYVSNILQYVGQNYVPISDFQIRPRFYDYAALYDQCKVKKYQGWTKSTLEENSFHFELHFL